MQPRGRPRRRERFGAAGQEGGGDPGEHVTGPPGRQGRAAGGDDDGGAGGVGDDAAVPLQHDRTPEALGGVACRCEPVRLDRGGRDPEQPPQLARVGGDGGRGAPGLEDAGVAGEGVQGVGVGHKGVLESGDRLADHVHRLPVGREPGPDRHGVHRGRLLEEQVESPRGQRPLGGLRQPQARGLEHPGMDFGDHRGPRRDRHQPGPRAECAAGGERGRARHADRPCDDHGRTDAAFVGIERPVAEDPGDVGLLGDPDHLGELWRRDADVDDLHLPGVLAAGVEDDAELEGRHSDRDRGPDGGAVDTAGQPVDPRWDVDGHHREAGLVDGLHRLGRRAGEDAPEPGPVESVDHEVGTPQLPGEAVLGEAELPDVAEALQVGARVAFQLPGVVGEHHHREGPPGREVAGRHEAVTAVAALAGQDDDPAPVGPAGGADGSSCHGDARPLHERERGGPGGDRRPVGRSHLLRGEDGQHGLILWRGLWRGISFFVCGIAETATRPAKNEHTTSRSSGSAWPAWRPPDPRACGRGAASGRPAASGGGGGPTTAPAGRRARRPWCRRSTRS